MSSTSVCYLFIDSAKKSISTTFDVNVSKKVSNLKSNALKESSQEGVGTGGLRVWKYKDLNTVFSDSDLAVLEDQIMEIFESQEVESLDSEQTAMDLQLSEQEYILLEILGMLLLSMIISSNSSTIDPPKKRKHEHSMLSHMIVSLHPLQMTS